MMRVALSIVAVGVIMVGLWLIASGFTESAPDSSAATHTIAAPARTSSPVGLGTALLAGGVVLFIVILRRR